MLAAAGLAALAAGCNSLANPRFMPRVGDVRTVVAPDPAVRLTEEPPPPPLDAGKTTAPGGRASLDRVEDESPLPPALARPTDPPAGATPVPAAPVEPTPLLDEALSRAQAETRAVVEEALKDDPKKPPIQIGMSTLPASLPAAVVPVKPPAAAAPPAAVPVAVAVAPPRRPEELWHDGVEQLRALARQQLKEGGGPVVADSWASWGLRDRVLGWLDAAEIDPDPRRVGESTRGRVVFRGLSAAIDADRPAPARGREIRDAVSALELDAPLEITELKLCRKVFGYGHVEPLEPAVRKPGQPVVVYCELAGVSYEADGASSFRSKVAATVEILPEHADKPVWSQPLGTAEDVCRKRRRDYYVNYKFNLPETLPPGAYRIRIVERDLTDNRQATSETAVAITR